MGLPVIAPYAVPAVAAVARPAIQRAAPYILRGINWAKDNLPSGMGGALTALAAADIFTSPQGSGDSFGGGQMNPGSGAGGSWGSPVTIAPTSNETLNAMSGAPLDVMANTQNGLVSTPVRQPVTQSTPTNAYNRQPVNRQPVNRQPVNRQPVNRQARPTVPSVQRQKAVQRQQGQSRQAVRRPQHTVVNRPIANQPISIRESNGVTLAEFADGSIQILNGPIKARAAY